MFDWTEYPGLPRQEVWYVDEDLQPEETIFSPIFDVDRSMGISDATVPRPPHVQAPTGTAAVGAGREADRFLVVCKGLRVVAHFIETGVAAVTAPRFELWVSCGEGNPITERRAANLNIPVGGSLLLDAPQGMPYMQGRIVNADAEFPVTICGALRLSPF